MQNRKTTKITFWQWLNILAIDACLVSVSWLWVFAQEQSAEPGMAAYTVLALSVWLTYVADRLFDASPRTQNQLLSARHQFAKRRARILWSIWAAVLAVNIILAGTCLSQFQLNKGFILLFLCLAYSGLNQLLSKKFFPKELLVAAIFAGGTQVFLPDYTGWPCLAGFTLLCFINCLMIGWKEASVDAQLKVRSMTSIMDIRSGYLLLAIGIGLSLVSNCFIALLPSVVGLSFLYLRHHRFNKERFRMLCDAALLIGPLLYLALHRIA